MESRNKILSTEIHLNTTFVDPRDIMKSRVVLQEGYTDQPYCVITKKKEWSCIVTGNPSKSEGKGGERVMSIVSKDKGKTWDGPFDIEPPLLLNAYGNIVYSKFLDRIYTIYNVNSKNVTSKRPGRADMFGNFFMKYSEDGGKSWSKKRYLVPYPSTWIDRQNSFHGKTNIMWTVDQVKVRNGTVYFAFTKIKTSPINPLVPPEEIFILASSNLLTEKDPEKVKWRLLPEGDHGIRAPAQFNSNRTVMEEGHILPLTSGGFYAMGRTDRGFLAAASTKDHTAASNWTVTGFARYWNSTLSNSKLTYLNDIKDPATKQIFVSGLKSPRGPLTPKQIEPNPQFLEYGNGNRYLLLFYNNRAPRAVNRDPYFLSAGIETKEGIILWSQPEVIIYDKSFHGGTSAGGYPDFIQDEESGEMYIIVAQKQVPNIKSAVHLLKIDQTLLKGLLLQHTATKPFEDDSLIVNYPEKHDLGSKIALPAL
eukprot:g1473.t1